MLDLVTTIFLGAFIILGNELCQQIYQLNLNPYRLHDIEHLEDIITSDPD
ncbi:hypothetical protein BofuT4_uP018300.1 [Botrytis cinerea T4]|uniref:Uncharacterized protein n=1 Tax=Botryotinia fuckeliana (strain T4) TaxID=999810 RepID=G2YII7_BOTF4|nr:hypothetical protein BofuT4_uP018300.1 [Botrytis cinerea T4]